MRITLSVFIFLLLCDSKEAFAKRDNEGDVGDVGYVELDARGNRKRHGFYHKKERLKGTDSETEAQVLQPSAVRTPDLIQSILVIPKIPNPNNVNRSVQIPLTLETKASGPEKCREVEDSGGNRSTLAIGDCENSGADH